MHTTTIALSCAAVVLVTAPSSAEPSPAELPHTMSLEYRVSPEAKRCPADGEDLLRSEVGGHLHSNPFDATAAARLVATIEPNGAAYVGRAEVLDAAGTVLWSRQLIPLKPCFEAIEALAFVIAFRLEPHKDAPASTSPPAPAPAPPPPCVAAPAPAPVRLPEPPKPPSAAAPPDPRRVLVGAGTALGFGVASAPALGLTVDLGVRWPVASVSLEGRAFLTARIDVAGSGQVAKTRRITGALVPCGHWRALALCIPLEIGTQTGHADPSGREIGLFYSGVGVRLGAELPFPHDVILRLAGDALYSTAQPRFHFTDAAAWRTPPFSGALNIGVGTYF